MGNMPRPRKVKNGKPLTIWIGEDLYLLLKQRFKNISETVRNAIQLYLQQQGVLQTQEVTSVPNNMPYFGRGISPGNMNNDMNTSMMGNPGSYMDMLYQVQDQALASKCRHWLRKASIHYREIIQRANYNINFDRELQSFTYWMRKVADTLDQMKQVPPDIKVTYMRMLEIVAECIKKQEQQ